MTVESNGNPVVAETHGAAIAAAADAPKALWVTPTVTDLDVRQSEVAAATSADADALS